MKYIMILILLSGCTINKSLTYPYQSALHRHNIELSVRPDTAGTNGVTFNTEIQYR